MLPRANFSESGFGRILPILCLAFAAAGCQKTDEVATKSSASPTAAREAAKATPKPVGRVTVEHGLDADASSVNQQPQTISVEDLLAMRNKVGAKVDLAAFHDRRIAPFETTTFEIEGVIKNIKHEKDGDYYLVLQGKTGAEAVVEVPDPKLCAGSPLLPKIQAARDALGERYKPTDTPKNLNEKITIDGVGFFGSRRKAGSGSFGSSVRLMPGTGVKFEK